MFLEVSFVACFVFVGNRRGDGEPENRGGHAGGAEQNGCSYLLLP